MPREYYILFVLAYAAGAVSALLAVVMVSGLAEWLMSLARATGGIG